MTVGTVVSSVRATCDGSRTITADRDFHPALKSFAPQRYEFNGNHTQKKRFFNGDILDNGNYTLHLIIT